MFQRYYLAVFRELTVTLIQNKKVKGKGKVRPITGHEGPEGEQMYSSTLP